MITNLKSKLKAMSSGSHSVNKAAYSAASENDPDKESCAASNSGTGNAPHAVSNSGMGNASNGISNKCGKIDPSAAAQLHPNASSEAARGNNVSTVPDMHTSLDATRGNNASTVHGMHTSPEDGRSNNVCELPDVNTSSEAKPSNDTGKKTDDDNTNRLTVPAEQSSKGMERGSFGGSIIQTEDGEFVRKCTVYGFDESYGRINLSDLLTTTFEDTQWWTRLDEELRIEDIVFLDTETTGLAGGAGTVAFLIGLGYIEEGGLVIDQYLMRDFDEEYPMLQAIMAKLKRFKVLITFNGKSFDWPLLESRLIYSRLRPISWEDSHLDLLHVARRLWSSRLDNCSLTSLEESILYRHRIGDIPGSQIPNIYLDYLQTRKTDEMEQVIQHNEWDIAAMAALLLHTAGLYSDPQTKGDSYELFGIARELERNHRIQEAAACYKACINASDNHSLILGAKKRFAYLTKRHKGPQEAMDLWADLAGGEGSLLVFPLIEMAKFLEHKEKDYQRALECTDRAIKLINKAQSNSSQRLKEELLHRKQRLIKKMQRSMELWG